MFCLESLWSICVFLDHFENLCDLFHDMFCVLLDSFNHFWCCLHCVCCLKCPYGHSESLCGHFWFFFMVVSSVLWSSWASFWSVWMAMWFFWASLWSSWVWSCFAYLCDHFERHYGCFEKPCRYFQHLWSLWVSLWTSIASLNSFWASLRSFLSSSSWLFCVLLGSFNHLWGFLPCVCLKCPYGHSESLCVIFEHLCGFFWVSLKLFCVFCGRLVCLIVLSLQSFEHHYDCFEKLCGYFQRLCGHSEGFFGFSERLCGHLLPQSLCGTVMNF